MSLVTIKDFRLESGGSIQKLDLEFHTFGKQNAAGDNVIWVCHALTANSNVLDWWEGLFGRDHLFDPRKYFIICVNIPGSCYGSTGPVSPLENKRPLLENFPRLTVRDAANAFERLREILSIEKVQLLLGASLGGQIALEWSIANPEVFSAMALIATNVKHSAYGIAFNESQRLAIEADSTYGNGRINGGRNGLIAARSIALLSYRSYAIYEETQGAIQQNGIAKAVGYQRYQGEKLARRFNAYSYVCLTHMMDSHDIGRNRASIESVLKSVRVRTLTVGITSDQLFPVTEQKYIAKHIPGAEFTEIESNYGHDGFLVETEKLSLILEDFLYNNFKNHKPTVFRTTVRKSQLMNLTR